MQKKSNFVSSNAGYDEEQIKASARLVHRQANEKPEYVFVNLDPENDAERKKDSRRAVRSQATAYSHRVAPRRLPRSGTTMQTPQSANEGLRSRAFSTALTAGSLPFSGASNASSRRPRKLSRPSPLHLKPSPGARVANTSRKRVAPRPSRDPLTHGTRRDRSLSPGAFHYVLPDPHSMSASMRDPFETYPVRYRSWYGQLIQFWYNVVFERGTRVVKATGAELKAYTTWSRRQELAEPALYYTALFLASGIPVAEGHFPLQAALWLRYKAIEALKEAIADPERASSTPVILAVGRIALHEHIYGNRELAHGVHRPAHRRMIEMRGGLANMGLPATTVQLIIWTDALLSAEAGTEPYFSDVPRQMAIRSYTPQEAIHVTNHCSPNRRAHPGYGRGVIKDEPAQ